MKGLLALGALSVVVAGCDKVVSVSPGGTIRTLQSAVEKVREMRAQGLQV